MGITARDARHQEHGFYVYIHYPIPIFFAELGYRRAANDPGIVEQNMNGAEFVSSVFDYTVAVRRPANVNRSE